MARVFGKYWPVIRNAQGHLRALDLRKDGIAEKVTAATNKDLMEALFAAEGMSS